MNVRIKENVVTLLSVCIVFSAIIVGLYFIRTSVKATKLTDGFYYGLFIVRNAGKLVYLSCAFSAVLVFAAGVVDAILKRRIVLSPLLSAVAFLLTLIPFVIESFTHIPVEWFVAAVLAVYAFSLMLSMRKMSRLSLGMGNGVVSMLKHPGRIKANGSFGTVDKAVAMALFWPMLIILLLDIALIVCLVVVNRQIVFRL